LVVGKGDVILRDIGPVLSLLNTGRCVLKEQIDMKKSKAQEALEAGPIEIKPIEMDVINVHVLGITPLIMHRKSIEEEFKLLVGKQQKNLAEIAQTLKHDPLDEYRQSMYLNRDRDEPTLVHFPAGAFSQTISTACKHMPGATQSQIASTVTVTSDQVNIYGVPCLGMDPARNSGINRSADIRSRPYFVEWCCSFDIEFMPDMIGAAAVMNLLNAGGKFVGIGDWRPGKGKGGTKGRFMVVPPNHPAILRIMKQGRVLQQRAYDNPTFFDERAQTLYARYVKDTKRREKTPKSSLDAAAVPKKRNGKARSIATRHGEAI
jgi:hypothetical protein